MQPTIEVPMPPTSLPVRLRIGDTDECDLGTITITDGTTHPEMVEHIAQLLEIVAARIRTWPSIRAEAGGTPPGDALPPG